MIVNAPGRIEAISSGGIGSGSIISGSAEIASAGGTEIGGIVTSNSREPSGTIECR